MRIAVQPSPTHQGETAKEIRSLMMSEPKDEQKPEDPKAEEHEGEHAHEKHEHGHHGHGHFHPEKYRREHAVIHPANSTVKHIDPGAVEI